MPVCIDNGAGSVKLHVVKRHLERLLDPLIHSLLRAVDQRLQLFVHVLSRPLVKPQEVEVVLVEQSLLFVLVVRRELLLLLCLLLIVDGARGIVELLIILFLLQHLWQLVRAHHLSELLARLELLEQFLLALLFLILALDLIVPVLGLRIAQV